MTWLPSQRKVYIPSLGWIFGILHNISEFVLLSCAIYFVNSLTISVSNFVRSLSGQSMRCIAVSLWPQFVHCSSRQESPEKWPTWTLVPQYPKFCLDLQILYMSVLFLRAKSRCSQSTALNLSLDHVSFLCIPRCWHATSLLAWNLRGNEISPVTLLFPYYQHHIFFRE